jgi:hypothetical protein
MVSSWNNVYLDNYKKSGAEFILGSGRFIGPKTVEATLPNGRTRDSCGGSDSVVLLCTYGAKSANADGWSGDRSMKVCEVECRTGITLIEQDMEKAALHRAALVMHKLHAISVRAAPGSIVCGSERPGTD